MKHIFLPIVLIFFFSGCSKPTAEDMFEKGVEAQKAGEYDAAIEAYQELIKAYPDSSRSPEAFYAVATIYQNQKKSFHRAIEAFRQLVEKYPSHPTAPNASFQIGSIYNNDLKNLDSARIAYEDFLKKYPENQLAESARFELKNLGKSPDEILSELTKMAQKDETKLKKGKKK
jgi:TolA-binding protein